MRRVTLSACIAALTLVLTAGVIQAASVLLESLNGRQVFPVTNWWNLDISAAPVAFKLVQSGESSARFENRAHDFPQRIEYRRAGQALRAEIAGPRGSKEVVIGFDYELCAADPKRP